MTEPDRKTRVGWIQIGESFGSQFYLPYAVGLLESYARGHLHHPDRYAFLTPIYRRLSAQLSGGLAAMYAQTDFVFSETLGISAPGGAPPSRVGDFKQDEWRLGFFGNAQLIFRLSDAMGLFVGGQYQHLGNTSVAGGGKEATLKLDGTFEAIAGMKFTF